MAKIVLKGGEVASVDGLVAADVLMDDGKIVAVGEVDESGAEVIDVSGKVVMPGAIDVHVHFREPGGEHKEDWKHASLSAAAGGVTTVFDMPNTNPPIIDRESLKYKRALIKGMSYINYGIYMGYNGSNAEEINAAEGIPGVKVYCAHSTGKMGVGEDHLEAAFIEVKPEIKLLFHSEDEHIIEANRQKFEGQNDPAIHSKIRSKEAAIAMTKKICEYAKKHKRPIHVCHVSTDEEVDLINEYREYGVTCEVAPHHLTLSEDDYGFLGNYLRMNPPVRDRMTVFGLWKALKMGMVDIIATDHAPHTREEKEKDYWEAPSGVPGVEMMLPILLNVVNDEGMEISEVVKLCCQRPAELFGLKTKGRVEVGYDADVIVVDMDKEMEFKDEDALTKCGWSPYSGSTYKGWPVMTFVGGRLACKDRQPVGEPQGQECKFN